MIHNYVRAIYLLIKIKYIPLSIIYKKYEQNLLTTWEKSEYYTFILCLLLSRSVVTPKLL